MQEIKEKKAKKPSMLGNFFRGAKSVAKQVGGN